MVKIAFWDNSLCERGTTTSLYDYAYFNETLLNNDSIIMYNTTHKLNHKTVIQKFSDRFKVYGVDNWSKVDNILSLEKVDILYMIKAGDWDGQLSKICKNVVHCVFNQGSPHGNIYSSISPYLPPSNLNMPIVPHMINLPKHEKNMREELNIPNDAIVYGRHGGPDQFDIKYVQKIVYNVAKHYKNIYFIFLNTNKFCESLPNIIHLSAVIDLDEKVRFINTCDAMLWARLGGESFGLAIGEFSTLNKPVMCTESEHYNAHIYLLGNKAMIYNETNLENMLINFNKEEMKNKDWNAYKDYTPENVMKIFKKVYID